MVKDIDLSIIIPTFNSEAYIKNLLVSLITFLENDNFNYQVILVDDGSTDETISKVKRIIKDKDFLNLYECKHQGVSAARNFGIKKAEGKYITFVDSDDTLDFTEFNKIKKQMGENLDIIMVNMPKSFFLKTPTLNNKIEAWKIINSKLGLEAPWAKFYKNSFIKESKLFFNEKIIIGEDTLFGYKAITAADTISFLPLKFYIQGEEHTLGRFKRKMLESELVFLKELNKIIEVYKRTKDFKELKYIENRYKCKEYFRLIRDYFTPLYRSKIVSLSEIKKHMKKVADDWNIIDAINNDPYGERFWIKRQKLYAALIKKKRYAQIIVLETLIQKLKDKRR